MFERVESASALSLTDQATLGRIASLGFQSEDPAFVLPRILGEPAMRLIRMSEHVGRPEVADWLANTRTVLTIAPLRWLAWNMAFHAEHHAVPSVPFHALPALHRELGPRIADVRRGYAATQLHLVRLARGRAG